MSEHSNLIIQYLLLVKVNVEILWLLWPQSRGLSWYKEDMIKTLIFM